MAVFDYFGAVLQRLTTLPSMAHFCAALQKLTTLPSMAHFCVKKHFIR